MVRTLLPPPMFKVSRSVESAMMQATPLPRFPQGAFARPKRKGPRNPSLGSLRVAIASFGRFLCGAFLASKLGLHQHNLRNSLGEKFVCFDARQLKHQLAQTTAVQGVVVRCHGTGREDDRVRTGAKTPNLQNHKAYQGGPQSWALRKDQKGTADSGVLLKTIS